jgi:hypothetical protein
MAYTLETRPRRPAGDPGRRGQLRLELVPPAVVAEDVTALAVAGAPAPLTVGRITARPSLISFLTETQVIRLLRIERPRLTSSRAPTAPPTPVV